MLNSMNSMKNHHFIHFNFIFVLCKVHRIRESPVLYLLNSISKLKPEKGLVHHHQVVSKIRPEKGWCITIIAHLMFRSYPLLDVDHLYKILTTKKSLLLANPQLGGGTEQLDHHMVGGDTVGSYGD